MKFTPVLYFALTVFSGCSFSDDDVNGDGNVKTESRPIDNASRIKVLGDIDVYITNGVPGVKVEADANLLPFIETITDDDWLKIGTRENYDLHSSNPIRVYVSTPNVTDVNVSGSGNVKSENKFSTHDDINFKIAGSGDITMNINTPKVDASIAGSGNLKLSGETRDIELSIAGSGDFSGPELKAENAKVKIAGSGNADVFAEDHLKVAVTGSGDVRYKGNAVVDSHITGSGTVKKLE